MGWTNSVHAYCRLAISAMQITPSHSCADLFGARVATDVDDGPGISSSRLFLWFDGSFPKKRRQLRDNPFARVDREFGGLHHNRWAAANHSIRQIDQLLGVLVHLRIARVSLPTPSRSSNT